MIYEPYGNLIAKARKLRDKEGTADRCETVSPRICAPWGYRTIRIWDEEGSVKGSDEKRDEEKVGTWYVV